jgi:hypothetical protein
VSGVQPVLVDEPHSYPCRQCLRDAQPGEQMLLMSYNPFRGESPYSGDSPVFIHLETCSPDADESVAPDQLTRRLLSVRAYDDRHMMRAADVVPGSDLLDLADRLLDQPDVAYLHVHNALPGCWAARIERRS